MDSLPSDPFAQVDELHAQLEAGQLSLEAFEAAVAVIAARPLPVEISGGSMGIELGLEGTIRVGHQRGRPRGTEQPLDMSRNRRNQVVHAWITEGSYERVAESLHWSRDKLYKHMDAWETEAGWTRPSDRFSAWMNLQRGKRRSS